MYFLILPLTWIIFENQASLFLSGGKDLSYLHYFQIPFLPSLWHPSVLTTDAPDRERQGDSEAAVTLSTWGR